MSEPSIHQLLGLPSDVTRPNAYQVFGLALGEADHQVIRAAIARRILTVKQAKSAADPDVWMQAVRAVQAAQKVLLDPEQKAALDAKYGILSDAEPAAAASESIVSVAADPLAALLPGSHSTPGSSPHAASDTDQARLLAGQPREGTSQPNAPVTPLVSAALADHRRARRRRGSGGLLFGSIVMAMLGLIVAGLAFMYFSGGNIQLVKNSDGFQVNSGSAAVQPGGSRVASPQATSKDRRGDGIMTRPSTVPPQSTRPADAPTPVPPATEIPAAETSAPDAAMPDLQAADTAMMSSPEMPATTPAATPPDVPTPGSGPSAEQMAAGASAIATAREAVLSGDWTHMKTLCEAAEKKAVSDDQKQAAETLYQFADLAVHYRSAIQKAMSELVAGNEFELTESMTFLVQKSSSQEITLYRNKRAYSYTIDDLPLSVAQALAPFGMNVSSPEGQAAEAIFQVISSKSTPGHRAHSIEVLRGLPPVEGADLQRLADFIASLDTP